MFRRAYGQLRDWLRLVTLPSCAMTTPWVASCQVQSPLETVNNRAAKTVTARVNLADARSTSTMVLAATSAPAGGSGSGNAPKTGDACWAGPSLHVSFGSISGDLVNDPATLTGWRVSNDDGTRVDYVTGGVNGTFDGGYWRLTGRNGTQYFFGRNQLSGYGANTPATNSAWTEPVYNNPPGCGAASCTMAWRWNLDYVVDTHHRAAAYFYTPERASTAPTPRPLGCRMCGAVRSTMSTTV